MSRTYVHAPHWVKVRHPQWRAYFREAHRHDTGPCDLDRFDPRAMWSATSCHIDLAPGGRNICCGCRMCTGQLWRKVCHRRIRTVARSRLREAVKTRSDVDIPTRMRW